MTMPLPSLRILVLPRQALPKKHRESNSLTCEAFCRSIRRHQFLAGTNRIEILRHRFPAGTNRIKILRHRFLAGTNRIEILRHRLRAGTNRIQILRQLLSD